MSNILLVTWDSTLSFDSVLSVIATILTVTGAYWVAKVQIRQSEKPFLEFSIQSTNRQKIRNIGGKVAINVHVYRAFLVITDGRKKPEFVDITLEHSLGTIKVSEEKCIDLLPASQSYEVFIIEYQNINGIRYRSVLRPQTGRGDHETLYIPKPIRFFSRKWNLAPRETIQIKMTRQIRDAYSRK